MKQRSRFAAILLFPIAAWCGTSASRCAAPAGNSGVAEATSWRGENAVRIPLFISAGDWKKAGFPAAEANARTAQAWLYVMVDGYQLQDAEGRALIGGPRMGLDLGNASCIRMRSLNSSVCGTVARQESAEQVNHWLRDMNKNFAAAYKEIAPAMSAPAPAAPAVAPAMLLVKQPTPVVASRVETASAVSPVELIKSLATASNTGTVIATAQPEVAFAQPTAMEAALPAMELPIVVRQDPVAVLKTLVGNAGHEAVSRANTTVDVAFAQPTATEAMLPAAELPIVVRQDPVAVLKTLVGSARPEGISSTNTPVEAALAQPTVAEAALPAMELAIEVMPVPATPAVAAAQPVVARSATRAPAMSALPTVIRAMPAAVAAAAVKQTRGFDSSPTETAPPESTPVAAVAPSLEELRAEIAAVRSEHAAEVLMAQMPVSELPESSEVNAVPMEKHYAPRLTSNTVFAEHRNAPETKVSATVAVVTGDSFRAPNTEPAPAAMPRAPVASVGFDTPAMPSATPTAARMPVRSVSFGNSGSVAATTSASKTVKMVALPNVIGGQ